MRCVGRAAAAIALAAAGVLFCAQNAAADAAIDRDRKAFLFFSGTDLWRHGSFSYGGMLWAPTGIDRDGFTFKLLIGGGGYRYLSGALGNVEVVGRHVAGFALPGWRVTLGPVIATVFAGIDIQHHVLTPDDPAGGLRGTMTGFRTGAEFWIEPDRNSMIAADAFFSTVGPSVSGRAAYGWRAFDLFYVGPEVQGFMGDDSYEQVRAGIHFTGVKSGAFEWSGAFGWADDSDGRDGLYGRVGVISRR